MNVTDILKQQEGKRSFSFEVLPPLKGNGTETLFRTIDKLVEMEPLFINITTHHSEYVYRETCDGRYERLRIRRRPGTVAIAATVGQHYGIPVVPHLICSGATAEDIEYELIDLQILGIENILVLRGDKAKDDRTFTPTPGGYEHADELCRQVEQFNAGHFIDGSPIKHPGRPFHYGVAAYPEKHDESPNPEMDLAYLKMKQDIGAEYAVTQLFYDNRKYFDFVAKARAAGITIPIIPALKPFAKLKQLNVVPKTFHCDLPQELAAEAVKCKTDDDARRLGIEWGIAQARELYAAGIANIHFFTVSAVDSVAAIAKALL